MTNISPQLLLREAEDCFRRRDYEQTLALLVKGFIADMEFRPFYTLTAQTLEQMNGESEARLFWHALEHFEDWEPFYDIGYHFIDTWHFEMAMPFLEKSHKLTPNNADVVHELALCYANTFQIGKAVKLLAGFDQHDFWTEYRMYRYLLLTSDAAKLPDYLSKSKQWLSIVKEEKEAIPQAHALLAELQLMWKRYQELADFRGNALPFWHFVQYGSVLLQVGSTPQQHGRFQAVKGSFRHVSALLKQLALQLSPLKLERVVYLENWHDAVLGKAIGQMLSIPAEEADGENLSAPNQLIVAAQNSTFNGEQDLIEPQKGQLLFAFRSSWESPAMLCPEFIGLLCNEYEFPWQEPKGERHPRQEPHPVIDQLIEKIINAPMADALPMHPFYQGLPKQFMPQNASMQPSRPVFRIESPVPDLSSQD